MDVNQHLLRDETHEPRTKIVGTAVNEEPADRAGDRGEIKVHPESLIGHGAMLKEPGRIVNAEDISCARLAGARPSLMTMTKELFMQFVDAIGTLAQTAKTDRAELDAAKQDAADAIDQSKLADTLTDQEADRVAAALQLIGDSTPAADAGTGATGATGPSGHPELPMGDGASGAESSGPALDGSPGTDTSNTASIAGRVDTVVAAHEENTLDTEASRGTSG